jgi:hypothetical protein
MTRIQNLVFVLLFAAAACFRSVAAAEETTDKVDGEPSMFKELVAEVHDGFSYRISISNYGRVQKTADVRSITDIDLKLARYQTGLDVRPDFDLNFRRLALNVKPRLELSWQKARAGSAGDLKDTEQEFYASEWLARYRIRDELFVSYSRENLKWGPSYLFSPSNPFDPGIVEDLLRFGDPVLDYARVVWIPSFNWTASFIANTGEGRNKLGLDFERAYAFKLDYTGEKRYFSIIPFFREEGNGGAGLFGGWTVSEALLLHVESGYASDRSSPSILVGGAYTLQLGPTIAVEYLHIDTDPSDILLGKNFLMTQYAHNKIRDVFNVVLRWTRDLDENLNRFLTIFGYEFGERTELFTVGSIDVSDSSRMTGKVLDYSVTVGVTYTF